MIDLAYNEDCNYPLVLDEKIYIFFLLFSNIYSSQAVEIIIVDR